MYLQEEIKLDFIDHVRDLSARIQKQASVSIQQELSNVSFRMAKDDTAHL